jgi:phosphoglycolate phosphatase
LHPVLLLWDVDCTLIWSGGAGEEALHQALLNDFGVIGDMNEIEIAGRTDRAIVRTIVKHFHLDSGSEAEFMECYLRRLPEELAKHRGKILPGVDKLLDYAHEHPEIHNAILTGNMKRGAEIKLSHYGLWKYFEFGAFADDDIDRNNLGPIALERARSHLKRDFVIDHTWVIGDTNHDIHCGKTLGCKTLAVATGRYSMEQLASHQPDMVLKDLSDFESVRKLWED